MRTAGGKEATKTHGRRLKLAKFRRLSLRAAVAESVFLIGLERNADVVRASSFAPLLNNVRGTRWSYNLINFNATHAFALPSYYAALLLRDELGMCTLRATGLHRQQQQGATFPAVHAAVSAGRTATDRDVSIKIANYGVQPRTLLINFTGPGWRSVAPLSHTAVLTSTSSVAENSLATPRAVVPQHLAVETHAGSWWPPWRPVPPTLQVKLPPYSVAVVRVAALYQTGANICM